MYVLSHSYLGQRFLMELRALWSIKSLCSIFYSNVGHNRLHLNRNSTAYHYISCQQSNLRVDGCLHYGGAMSGSISYPRVDGVAGYGTTLGIVNYISDKVF